MQPKLIPPSMREKKRYIVFKIISEDKIRYDDFSDELWSVSLSFLGEYGSSSLGIWFIKNLYNELEQKGIIKCSHDTVEEVRTVLSMIKTVSEKRCIVHIMGVTGTIKSAKTKYFE